MLYTVTMHPALDYVVTLPKLQVGAIQTAQQSQIFCGGKGINVSTILHRLGVASIATGFLAGSTGHALEQALEAQGIATRFVWCQQGNTRINVKLHHGKETDINGQGATPTVEEQRQLYDILRRADQGDIVVCSGSVPRGMGVSVYQDLALFCMQKGQLSVIDASGELLEQAILARPFLIKPNAEELGALFGDTITSAQQAIAYGKQLQAQGVSNVLISLGAMGAVLLWEDGTVYMEPALRGKVVHTVGAGDSLLAGFLAGFVHGLPLQTCLHIGVACGSATAFTAGLATKEQLPLSQLQGEKL